MVKVGIVAASLDPITRGHTWLIRQGCRLVDELHVVIGVNPTKKYYFDADERHDITLEVLKAELTPEEHRKTSVVFLKDDLLINYAGNVKASHIIRGIRTTEDFNYEAQMQLVNKKINPDVETIFLIPPAHLTQVSSSTVKGLVGFNGWEKAVEDYIHPLLIDRFKAKLATRPRSA